MTDAQRQQLATLDPLAAVSLTIFGEARGEPIEGQVGVGSVIRNRLALKRWGATLTAVCLAPKQFSCWLTSDRNFAQLWTMAVFLSHGGPLDTFDDHDGWPQVRWVAVGIRDGVLQTNIRNATHYVSTDLLNTNPPEWVAQLTPCAIKGRHAFFNNVP